MNANNRFVAKSAGPVAWSERAQRLRLRKPRGLNHQIQRAAAFLFR
jgi:hypothetical protein